jgi:2-oxoglutarate ferredoxin oxidoreductase subunit alpha
VLAPKSFQECADYTYMAFDLADKYRMPAVILADGVIGQMIEGVALPPEKTPPKREWSVGNMAASQREAIHITSLELTPEKLEAQTKARFARYEKVKAEEIRFEDNECAAADLVMVAYGTSARVCLGAQMLAKKEGIKLGIFRPITLWPFPYQALGKIVATGKPVLTVEMSEGQLVEDVKLSAYEASATQSPSASPSGIKSDIHLLAHSGGIIPTEEEVFEKVKEILKK